MLLVSRWLLLSSIIDSTLNTTAYVILRYGSTNASDPTSSDWTYVPGDECVDFDDVDLAPLVTKDALSTWAVGRITAFDSTFGEVVYGGHFRFNTTYSVYPCVLSPGLLDDIYFSCKPTMSTNVPRDRGYQWEPGFYWRPWCGVFRRSLGRHPREISLICPRMVNTQELKPIFAD